MRKLVHPLPPLFLSFSLLFLFSLLLPLPLIRGANSIRADSTGYEMDGKTPLCWESCVTVPLAKQTEIGSAFSEVEIPAPANPEKDFENCPSSLKSAGFDDSRPLIQEGLALSPLTMPVLFSYTGDDVICTKAGGGCHQLSHINIHACVNSVSLCHPFVANNSKLSTHSPSESRDLPSLGTVRVDDLKIVLSEGVYTAIGHFRFRRKTNETTVCQVDAASALSLIIKPNKDKPTEDKAAKTDAPPTSDAPKKEDGGTPTWVWAVVGIGGFVAVAIVAVLFYYLHQRGKAYNVPPVQQPYYHVSTDNDHHYPAGGRHKGPDVDVYGAPPFPPELKDSPLGRQESYPPPEQRESRPGMQISGERQPIAPRLTGDYYSNLALAEEVQATPIPLLTATATASNPMAQQQQRPSSTSGGGASPRRRDRETGGREVVGGGQQAGGGGETLPVIVTSRDYRPPQAHAVSIDDERKGEFSIDRPVQQQGGPLLAQQQQQQPRYSQQQQGGQRYSHQQQAGGPRREEEAYYDGDGRFHRRMGSDLEVEM